MQILIKRKLIIILVTLIVGLFSAGYSFLISYTPLYRSVCIIKYEKHNQKGDLLPHGQSLTRIDDIEAHISLIMSFSFIKDVAERLGILPHNKKISGETLDPEVVNTIHILQSGVNAIPHKESGLINIHVTNKDPELSQAFANTISDVFKTNQRENFQKYANQVLEHIKSQLNEYKKKYEKSENELNRFNRKHQLVSINVQGENILDRKEEIQTEIRGLMEIEDKLNEILTHLNYYINNPNQPNTSFYSSFTTIQYNKLNDYLSEYMRNKDKLLEDFTPQHPEVISLNHEIIETARRMKKLLQIQIQDTKKKNKELISELKEIDDKTRVLIENKIESNRLKRKADQHNNQVALLEKKYQETKIRLSGNPENISIIKPAEKPLKPVNPQKILSTTLLGTIIGFVIGILITLIVEKVSTSQETVEEIEEFIGCPVIGDIPYKDSKDFGNNLHKKYSDKFSLSPLSKEIHLISHYLPRSDMAESFRALRTSILSKHSTNKVKTLLITSTSPREGKTLITINLAITLAQAGSKIIVIDSDLRNPSLAEVLGIDSYPGVADILLGTYKWRDALKTITDLMVGTMNMDEVLITPGLDNLHMITCGTTPPNPAELLGSNPFKTLINDIKQEYDFIIFDSPSLFLQADTNIINSEMDAVLLVHAPGIGSKKLLRRSVARLNQESNIIGVVINNIKPINHKGSIK